MKINLDNYSAFSEFGLPIYFSRKDERRIRKMNGRVRVVSTVCPDYPHDGEKYVFNGDLGESASLTAIRHLRAVPGFLDSLSEIGLEVDWTILVADLPELVDAQKEFFERVAGSKEEYIRRCCHSVINIEKMATRKCGVMTFSQFYSEIDYLFHQEEVARNILAAAEHSDFSSKFNSFVAERAELAKLFRGRALSRDELREAAAHGMSLYVTHGTLIRERFLGDNVIIVNHLTTNLTNFHLAKFFKGHESLENTPKIPLGIIDSQMY
ncbi:MAG: hypothetical protein PF572_06735 [Patescibacteria group bacterium]|jgi:hypothetical protein|nr:hypothetical protein [Patescibacteria group bacterium]